MKTLILIFFAATVYGQVEVHEMRDFTMDVRSYVYVPYDMEHDMDGKMIPVQVTSSDPKVIQAWVAVDEFEFPTLGSGKITTDIIVVAALSIGESTITVKQLDEQKSFVVTTLRSSGPPSNPFELVVYPNPVTDNTLYLKAKTNMAFNELGYRIFDSDGNRKINQGLVIIEGQEFVKIIDISALAELGIYVIRLYLNGETWEEQFIRQ